MFIFTIIKSAMSTELFPIFVSTQTFVHLYFNSNTITKEQDTRRMRSSFDERFLNGL